MMHYFLHFILDKHEALAVIIYTGVCFTLSECCFTTWMYDEWNQLWEEIEIPFCISENYMDSLYNLNSVHKMSVFTFCEWSLFVVLCQLLYLEYVWCKYILFVT